MAISTWRKRLLFVIVVLLAAAFAVTNFSTYRGDGLFRDKGWLRLGYRYEIFFEEFIVKEESVTKVYKFSGAASEEYTLELNVLPTSGSEPLTAAMFEPLYELLKSNEVLIEARLLQDNEGYIHALPSRLGDDWGFGFWKLYNSKFNNIKLSRKSEYELKITIAPTTKLSHPISFQPVLVGGEKYVF